MNPHNLPPLPPIGQRPAPGTTHTNPGLVSVASQCFPAIPPEADQTQVRGQIPTGSLINSNGESQQQVNPEAIGSKGVTVSASSGHLANLSGEGGQRLDLKLPDLAVATGSGLPVEVKPDFVSHVKPSLPDIAVTTSPAVTMDADTRSKGGLPITHMIR